VINFAQVQHYRMIEAFPAPGFSLQDKFFIYSIMYSGRACTRLWQLFSILA